MVAIQGGRTAAAGLFVAWLALVAAVAVAADRPYKLVADQPVPVRWATAARKLPLKYEPVPATATRHAAVTLHAVKREGVSFQVSLGPDLEAPADVREVRLRSLSHAKTDETIDGDAIELRTVGRVRDRKRGEEWPDVLFPLGTIEGVADGYAYTLWVTIYVPADAAAGRYTGDLTMTVATGGRTQPLQVPVKLHVRDHTLPADVPVTTELFRFDAGSVDLWYGFEDRAARIAYTTEKVYPRYVRNRLSPGRFVPATKPLYMRRRPYATGGPHGRYRRFDGTTGDDTGFRIDQTKPFTVTLWARPVAGEAGSLLAQWGGGPRGMEWRVGPTGALSVRFRADKEGRAIESIGVDIETGAWSHLAVAVEDPVGPERVITVYHEGRRVARRTIPGLKPSGRTLHLGSAYRTTIRPYTGALDEVRVYPRALGAAAVRRDKVGDDDLVATAAFTESYSEGASPDRVGKAYLKKWGVYWRDRGLHLNQLPVPETWGKERLERFFRRMLPVIESHGWSDYLYVRLPYDEATAGRKAARNRAFARRMAKVAPKIRRHQTFGGGLRGDAVEKTLEPHAGVVDIWCSVPGHYLKRFSRVKRWLYQRREAPDEALSWYIHRNISVGNGYKDAYTAMDLRGFFWRMFQEKVTRCALWTTTNWDRRTPKHADRDPKRVARGFSLRPSTPTGVGNGLLFYPGETPDDMILDSIRAQIIRDGIEDYQYLQALRRRGESGDDARARALLDRIRRLGPRFVRFGPTVKLPPEKLTKLRKRMADVLASPRGGRTSRCARESLGKEDAM